MAAVTKNRNFFNCPLLLYYKSKCSNSSHFEWRAGLSDTILKGDHPRTISAKFALIWFSGFRGKDLNVVFYQNMSNLYNWYNSYMAMSSLTYILGFSVSFFQPVYSI
jgi:hypothetical protein